MFSLDQNCHSLWDVLPKLQALGRRGIAVRHYIEDVDVAFTAMGAISGGPLHLAKERFHRSGGADWGAALFYSEFLGRLPVEIRDWEPFTGMKTAALARQIGRSVDELYDEFSPSDNWQLIGPSYVGDQEHHRTIGDLSADETAEFVRQILDRAQADTLGAFPAADARRRAEEWFAAERRRLDGLLARRPATLVELYSLWLGSYLTGGTATLDLAGNLLSPRGEMPGLLDVFTRDYDTCSDLYNQAVEKTHLGLHPLQRDAGELPFFASLSRDGRLVRTAAHLEDGHIRIGQLHLPLRDDGGLPLEALAGAGVRSLAGKALLLVLQLRSGPAGDSLALPHRGSMYVPAAHRLGQLLREHSLLEGSLRPITRVRLRLLDRLADVDTTIRPPVHLRKALGRDELPARDLAGCWRELAADAARRLEGFRDISYRQNWQRHAFPEIAEHITGLDARRRELADKDPTSPQIRSLSHEVRQLKAAMMEGLLRQIDRDWQVRDLEYYDSRGAVLPWCIALGGEPFYNDVIARAELREETG